MKKVGTKVKSVMQKLLWIPPGEDRGAMALTVPPIPYKGQRPNRLWTLLGCVDPKVKPPIPERLIHLENAFLEDYIHDWNIRAGFLHYYSRTTDGGVWVVLEFEQLESKHLSEKE